MAAGVPATETLPRALAFYLPQYHAIPENDRWWGPGFTEWTNVAKAQPLFPGHYQPHIPADLGFYDLRLPEVRAQQAALARDAGIHGFCYYHYWFNGHRLLERPFNDVLASGEPDFPFALCWANEDWTRKWDGRSGETLIGQSYGPDDDLAHIRALAPAFADPRYIRVNGRPLFLVYKIEALPEPKRTAELWRSEAQRLGIGDLFLCRVERTFTRGHPADFGFDAAVAFEPDFGLTREHYEGYVRRAVRRVFRPRGLYRRFNIAPYDVIVRDALNRMAEPVDYIRWPSVCPSWDNSPRTKEGGWIFRDSSPEKYERWLREAVRSRPARAHDEDLIFLTAWNEWGEGNHLEPDLKYGHAWLDATRRGLGVSDAVLPE